MAGRMAEAMASSPACAPVAVVSTDQGRRERFAARHRVTGFASFEEALSGGDVDAVYVASANPRHVADATAAIEAGRPTLVEKPLAPNAAEAEALFAAAAARNVLVMEALWTLFLPAWRGFIDAAKSGALGTPRHLMASFGHVTRRNDFPRFFDGDGVIGDRLIYPVALAVAAFGNARVTSAGVDRDADGAPTHAALTLRHETGGVSQLAASFDVECENGASLACGDGAARLGRSIIGAEFLEEERRALQRPGDDADEPGTKEKLLTAIKAKPAARRAQAALGSRARFLSYGADQYHPMLAHFADLARSGATESSVASPSFSLAVRRLLDATLEGR